MPWVYLLTYVGLRYLQSSGGLPALRDLLWTPVMQYSDRSMSQLCFDHLLNLSLAFHTRRKTGEVLRILDRGAAINRIFELLLFNLVPIVADIGAALVVFVIYFEWTLALVVAVTMVA
jgi:ABC-type transport system involved in Fe-S cluster assembly fused permease/ATPase subunit